MRRPLIALFSTFLTLLCGSLSAQSDVFNTLDVCRLKSISAAYMSADGQWIAYTRSLPRDPLTEDGRARRELWVTKGDDEGRLFLAGAFGGVKFSPDSKSIMFSAKRGKDKVTSLYLLPLDGGEAQKVLNPVNSIRSYDLSPDGRHIAYTCNKKTKTSPWRKKGFDQKIFGEEELEVQMRQVDRQTQQDIEIALDGACWELAYSPDSKKIAFWMSPTATIDDRYMKRRLWGMNVADGKVEQIVKNPGKVGNFVWSPDSTQIAFISAIDAHDPKESTLMVANLATKEVKILTPKDYDGHVSAVRWLDFGGVEDKLVFLVNKGCYSYGMKQSPNGGPIEHLSDKPVKMSTEKSKIVWRSLELIISKAGGLRFCTLGESAEHPRELYVDGSRLTHSNPETIDSPEGVALGKQTVVRYQARDGQEIEGVLIWPLNYEEGKRYPLINMIHGGPEAHYSDAWLTAYSMPGQVAAARGYFVFHPNYRSSTGRGVAFSKLGQGRSAREEFDDIVDGVDHLVKLGLVDKDKVGITGGSYGGYASAWGATYYSDRFAASVMFVGISEQLSKIFTTDIPNESFLVHWRMRPFGNWQKYLEASPIYYTERAKTPILICHGEKDPRVPVAQSIELYRALKMKGGVPVRLVLYPREQHGNRSSAARLDYGLRQMRWFDNYLQKDGKEMPKKDLDYGASN